MRTWMLQKNGGKNKETSLVTLLNLAENKGMNRKKMLKRLVVKNTRLVVEDLVFSNMED